jgi:hypothetical protein
MQNSLKVVSVNLISTDAFFEIPLAKIYNLIFGRRSITDFYPYF